MLKLLTCLLLLLTLASHAQSERSDIGVTTRVGYLKGLLPGLAKLNADLQTASTPIKQRFAVDKAFNWITLYSANELGKPEIGIHHISVIKPGIDTLKTINAKYRFVRVQGDFYRDRTIPDPAFEEVKIATNKMLESVLEEANNPALVNKSLPVYNESIELALKFTIGFLSSYAELPGHTPKDSLEFYLYTDWVAHNLSEAQAYLVEHGFDQPEVFRLFQRFKTDMTILSRLLPKEDRPRLFGRKAYDKVIANSVSRLNALKNEYYAEFQKALTARSCKRISE